jgi:hypothetical protein
LASKIISGLNENLEKEARKIQGENISKGFAEHLRKLDLLLDHYKIKRDPETQWLMLAYNLAIQHVDGFKKEEEKSRGRKEDWDILKVFKLFLSVRLKLIEKPNQSRSWACEQLVKVDPWKKFSKKTLENKMLNHEKNPLVIVYNHSLETARKVGCGDQNTNLEKKMIKDIFADILKF